MDELLTKLKNKPIPKKNEPVTIKINIIDRRDTEDIDAYKEMIKQYDDYSNIVKNNLIKDKSIIPSQRTPLIESRSASMPKKTKVTIRVKKSKTASIADRITKPPSLKADKQLSKEEIVVLDKVKQDLPILEDTNINITVSNYYLNNREIFMNFINKFFNNYKKELESLADDANCDNTFNTNDLFIHQKIVRDYLNLYAPYRGLLLYHGLGSGKTCSSIAIAESLKSNKKIKVLTPASLKQNYLEEIKKCGDIFYKTTHHWKFLNVDAEVYTLNVIEALADLLNVSKSWVKKYKGLWVIDTNMPPNYENLSILDKRNLNMQIEEMIKAKYEFISYNGLNINRYNKLSKDNKINIFDNSVVIIDEAHNFISRIVNKIKQEDSLWNILYNRLMEAENAKIVLLSGTPIINYPNEIGVMFNILRGFIKTWDIRLEINTTHKINNETIKNYIENNEKLKNIIDFSSYSNNTLTFTRNPFGFINVKKNKYEGVQLDEQGNITDADLLNELKKELKIHKIDLLLDNVPNNGLNVYKLLPDRLETFKDQFITSKNELKNKTMLKKRIVGLTSYYPGASEKIMPRFNRNTNIHIIEIPMSDYQFPIYESARREERKLETNNKRKKKAVKFDELYKDNTSTYRIFSRAYCNFVFPKAIDRPMPDNNMNLDEDDLDALTEEQKQLQEEVEQQQQTTNYAERIKRAIELLDENKMNLLNKEQLQLYSPKMLNVLENINDENHYGLHLVYSQFRTLEGIGIFSLILKANGFAEFKIKKDELSNWQVDINDEDRGKPCFALYTGSEQPEEKEIIRNIYNSDWEKIPQTILDYISQISSNNLYGEIIKTLMITASGAEGINLKNTRYVHIMEPYWHPVRIEQVIGRARRICSHKDLPEEYRTVDVFLYLMTFSEEQLLPTNKDSIELRLKDKGKLTDKPLTSDEALHEISNLKENITRELLMTIKQTSIDCKLHKANNNGEPILCYNINNANINKFNFQGPIKKEETENIEKMNLEKIKWKAQTIFIKGVKYAMRVDNNDLYLYDDYTMALSNPEYVITPVAKLEFVDKQPQIIFY